MGDETSAGIAVLGAGPAGLTAAHVLGSRGEAGVVFEADSQVGGIAKTVEHDGFRFDLGGHRFFTKVPWVQEMWEQVLGDEFLVRPRLSRIYYRGDYFAYPLRVEDVVRRLGMVETARCVGSYVAAKMRRAEPPQTFEDWVTGRFGRRLYDAFFREYTEKVWGIPGSEIQAEWAAQRIRNLSFWTALTSALRLRRRHVTSLIEEFHYPRLGPGQMWERVAEQTTGRGVDVRLEHRVTRVFHDASGVHGIEVHGPTGATERIGVERCRVEHPALGARPLARSASARRRCGGGTTPALPRPARRRPDLDRPRAVPGQLDLPPRSGHARRPGAELRRLEPRDDATGVHVPRRRVFLLPG